MHHDSSHALALATRAATHSTVFASLSFALSADPVSVDSDLSSLAHVEVLQCGLHLMTYWLALLRARLLLPAVATSHEHLKNVGHVSTAASFSKSLLAVLVIHLSLLGIAQNLVSNAQLLELPGVTSLVRVLLERLFPEGLLNFILRGFFVDAQEIIELLIVDFLLFSSASHFL